MSRKRYGFIPSIVLPLLIVASANATTRRVPSEFPTIQAGINASAVSDTVLVAPGTYTGVGNYNLTFDGKDLVVTSEAGAEATILDAQGGPYPMNMRRVFVLTSGVTAAARIDGFTITGGRSYGAPGNNWGAGIYCGGASPTIANCIIRGNWSGDGDPAGPSKDGAAHRGCGSGGGIFIEATPTPMTIVNCRIEENGAECWGAAIGIWNADDVVFDRCVIVQSRSMGVAIQQPANCTFTNCTIANTAMAGGEGSAYGLVVGPGVNVVLDHSVVWGNCLGVWIESGASVQATCCLIDSSTVQGAGGIVYVGQNLFVDPLFCDPRACPSPAFGDVGDYRVDALSPCLPQNNPCGVLIGALGSCDADTDVPQGTFMPEDALFVSPNPFATTTTFSLPVTIAPNSMLTVFDIAGRRVREFRLGDARTVMWDGNDERGARLGAGMYFVQTQIGARNETARVTLVR